MGRLRFSLFPLINYHFGMAAKQSMRYNDAIASFNQFIASYAGKDAETMISAAQTEVKGIELAMLKIAPASLSIQPVQGVNGIYNEMGLAAWESELYYTSIATQSPLAIDKGQYVLYVQSKSQSLELKGLLSDSSHSIGSVAISDDGSKMVYSECLSDIRDNTSQCHLRLAKRDSLQWSTMPAFSDVVNHEKFTSTHPAIRQYEDHYVIYFVSDRDLGTGGLDLYECTLLPNGEVKGPNPLHSINTPMDEISPFYDQFSERLYFSSNGHAGLGGFDVFYTSEDSLAQWAEPKNIMRPLNSYADDVFYRKAQGKDLIDESERGYLISNRGGELPFTNTVPPMMIFSFLMYLHLISRALFLKPRRMGTFH